MPAVRSVWPSCRLGAPVEVELIAQLAPSAKTVLV